MGPIQTVSELMKLLPDPLAFTLKSLNVQSNEKDPYIPYIFNQPLHYSTLAAFRCNMHVSYR